MLDLGLHGWFTAFACAVQLAYSVLSFVHGGRSRGLGIPLGLLTLTVFGWNFADLAREHSQQFEWRYLDVTLAPLTSAFTVHYIIGFVGERRRLRYLLWSFYISATALALGAGTSFFATWGREFITSVTYTAVHAVLISGVGVLGFGLIIRHWRRHTFGMERLRTRLLIIGGIFHTFVGTSELWWGFGIEMPRLASFGTLVSMSLWFIVTFRLNLLEQTVPIRLAIYTVLVASVGVVSYLIVLEAFSANTGALVVGTFVITIGAVVATSRIWVASNQERARLEKLAFLGRLADQMAHDLRNPLSVIMGAAQVLQGEMKETGATEDPDGMLPAIVEQSARISRMIKKYRRLGRIELNRSTVDLNQLIEQTVRQSALGREETVTLHTEYSEGLTPCSIDRDLMTVTLENLLRNAAEAMPEGGDFYVVSRRENERILVIFRDTGQGMNPRTLEHCFDEMFSTKQTGSGLGLPFAKQVVEAHRGSIVAESAEGKGTEIRLRLPCGGS